MPSCILFFHLVLCSACDKQISSAVPRIPIKTSLQQKEVVEKLPFRLTIVGNLFLPSSSHLSQGFCRHLVGTWGRILIRLSCRSFLCAHVISPKLFSDIEDWETDSSDRLLGPFLRSAREIAVSFLGSEVSPSSGVTNLKSRSSFCSALVLGERMVTASRKLITSLPPSI